MSSFIITVFSIAAAVVSVSSQTYLVDESAGLGRRFDGIGGLSGGGATSKLLISYPEIQRSQILDFLFKPNYGASLHILKVEIGGDIQSTDGTEASHMHNSWDENYNRGYEWWLMLEAKKRNPDVLIYGLPWGWPGWLRKGVPIYTPYIDLGLTASYIVNWVNGAKKTHNLTIDFIGIWNERDCNISYIKVLRSALDTAGLSHTRIVAPDGSWTLAKDIIYDSALAAAVDYIGAHYPGTLTTEEALITGKQLWSSEDLSTFNDNVGAGCWGRILNQNYVNGYMTSTISWNLIASYYVGLRYTRCGLMTAMEPWSGHYVVESPIWITAHTTQFARPGWSYLRHYKGVGKLLGGGSFVSLVCPDVKHLTIIIETMSHNHSQCIRPALPPYTVVPQKVIFKLQGKFANLTEMNVWYSELMFNGSASVLMQKWPIPVPVVDGEVTLNIGVDQIYTLTSIPLGQHGTAPEPPPSKPFPIPFMENFERYTDDEEPFYFAQQTGTFEVHTVTTPYNKIMRQMVTEFPIPSCQAEYVYRSSNIIGNYSWSDVYIQLDVNSNGVNSTSGTFIAVRLDKTGCYWSVGHGIFFFIFPANQTYLVATNIMRKNVTRQGVTPFLRPDWNTVGLQAQNDRVVGMVNGHILFNISAPATPLSGFVGLGTDSFAHADFDNVIITSKMADVAHYYKPNFVKKPRDKEAVMEFNMSN